MSSRAADLEDLGAPRGGQRDAGRVVEVRDRVEELDPLAGRAGRRDRLAQRLGHQAVGVHLGVHHVALVGLEDAQRADVRRRLADHHVAGVAEDPGDQVDRLLRADGDHDVVGVRLDALQAHHVGDLLAQLGDALARAVLHRLGTVVGDQVGRARGPPRRAAARRCSACHRPARPPRAARPRRTGPGSRRRSSRPCGRRTGRRRGRDGAAGAPGCCPWSPKCAGRGRLGARDRPTDSITPAIERGRAAVLGGPMSRKVVRLTVDHLAAARGAVPHLPVLAARSGEQGPGRRGRPGRREGGLGLPGAARLGLLRAGGAGRRPAGRLPDLRTRQLPARCRSLRDRAGLAGRGAAHQRLGAPAARRRRAGPDARAGHGPRPDQARRHQGGGGLRRHPRAGAAQAAAWCPRTSWAASASRPSARTPRRRGCGWSCATRSRSRTRSRRRWSAWWARCARPSRARSRAGCRGATDAGLRDSEHDAGTRPVAVRSQRRGCAAASAQAM